MVCLLSRSSSVHSPTPQRQTDRHTERQTDRAACVLFLFFFFPCLHCCCCCRGWETSSQRHRRRYGKEARGPLRVACVFVFVCVYVCVCGGGGLFLLFLLFLLLSPSSHPASSTLKRLCVSPQVLPVENYVNDLADHTFDQLLQSNRFLKVRFENSKRVCFHFSPALPSMFLAP